jgi:2-keto-4-pentenoate hydratase/2-oxohepta-3-ene-1,7-dioic acid hydratase in catechol pathway
MNHKDYKMTNAELKVGDLNLRLANLRVGGGLTLGAEIDGQLINITRAGNTLSLPVPADMDDLIQNSRAAEVRAIVDQLNERGEAKSFVEPESTFAPLVTRPQKIICVGFNYRAHAAETGTEIPKAPPLFSKFVNALNHHDGVVKLPTAVDREFDYETELVVVFGQKCKNVSKEDALSVVAGYSVGNDVSARGLQNITSQFMAGKMSDGFAPVGPWLATRDLITDPNNLRLQTRMNGEIRQDSSTREMIFNCKEIISYVTSIMTIEAGDILFTGTPPGVIWGQKVPRNERQWLKAGDRVISSIEGLGELAVDFR